MGRTKTIQKFSTLKRWGNLKIERSFDIIWKWKNEPVYVEREKVEGI